METLQDSGSREKGTEVEKELKRIQDEYKAKLYNAITSAFYPEEEEKNI